MIRIVSESEIDVETVLSGRSTAPDVYAAVSAIIADVREHGDEALFRYGKKFDGADLTSLEVTEAEKSSAMATVEPEFLAILNEAAENIRRFHRHQLRDGFRFEPEDGVVLGQRFTPIEKVGIYVPGGTASYPSTVLMDCIPAKIAGCREIIMVSPPSRNGSIAPVILAAAVIAGVDRIFKVGGAQAIAALALGTESLPKVYKIVGPGNAFVAEAKRQVFGQVAIDMIAGPSEIAVIADGMSDPVVVAADMLSQAEHGETSAAVLMTDSTELAKEVQAELERQLELLPRAEMTRKAIDNCSLIIVTDSVKSAVKASNAMAPEHLELCVDNPFDLLPLVTNAGSIFLGRSTPEALGDYFAGPNHTLPTVGTARFSSPLSVDDFVKKSSFTCYTHEALHRVSDKIAIFAEREGLHAHARSATIRFGGDET